MKGREHGAYKRSAYVHADAAISINKQNWQAVLLSEFKNKFQGKICRAGHYKDRSVYGVAFKDADPELKIQIDENVLGMEFLVATLIT